MSKTLIPKSFKASIDRALHNLYNERSTTFHPMTAVPLFYRRMMRGDTFDFGVLESILRSEPTFSPLLSNWRLRFEWYFDSDANRYGWIDNNTRLTSQEVMSRLHHRYITYHQGTDDTEYPTDVFGRGCISDYAGIAPGYMHYLYDDELQETDEQYGNTFNVDFHLTYLNIIRNYHVNRQFPNIPYTAGRIGVVGSMGMYSYSLDNLDKLFMFLRSCPNGVLFRPYLEDCDAPTNMVEYYGDALYAFYDYLRSSEIAYGGLFCTQFEPDLYQNLLNKDRGLLQATIQPAEDGFTIEEFRLKNHLQGLYDKIFVSGGTDRELSRTIWGIDSNRQYDIPELLCVHSEIIGTNLVTSSTAGEVDYDGETMQNVPGSMAGNINTRRGAGRVQKFTAKTSGSLMCIVSLTPLVAYSQNIERHLLERNFMDEFTPDMARKGFEDIPMSDYCVLPEYDSEEGVWIQRHSPSSIVGKQVAWLREMTSVNRVHGEFSNGGEKRDWKLLRNYQVDVPGYGIRNEISPYGNPLQYQYPFVSQDLYSPNFSLEVAFKCEAIRPVPRRFMPNLGN